MYLQGINVSKYFGGLPALRSVDFEVEQRQIIGLIGPNGAGKSTLFNVIAGVCRPDGGEVYLNGKLISGKRPEMICHLGISRTFQIVKPFLRMTVLDNATVGALHTIPRVNDARDYAAHIL